MNGSFLGFFVELFVTLLLAATIVYCFIVNRKLDKLRADQNNLKLIIKDLNQSTLSAEKAIGDLSEIVDRAGQDLGERIDHAEHITDKLVNQHKNAENILEKLTSVARAAQKRTGFGYGSAGMEQKYASPQSPVNQLPYSLEQNQAVMPHPQHQKTQQSISQVSASMPVQQQVSSTPQYVQHNQYNSAHDPAPMPGSQMVSNYPQAPQHMTVSATHQEMNVRTAPQSSLQSNSMRPNPLQQTPLQQSPLQQSSLQQGSLQHGPSQHGPSHQGTGEPQADGHHPQNIGRASSAPQNISAPFPRLKLSTLAKRGLPDPDYDGAYNKQNDQAIRPRKNGS